MKKSIISLAIATSCSSAVVAQNSSPLQLSYQNQLRNSDASGSVAIDRFDARGGVPLILEKENLLALGYRYAMDRYDFNGTTANWQTIHHQQVALISRWGVNEHWLWANYLIGGHAAEESANKSDAFNLNYLSLVEYKVSDRLTIGPGVVLATKFDRDLKAIPIFYVKWKFNNELSLGSGPSDISPAGANVYFTYTPKSLDQRWDFTLGASYSNKNFRIADTTAFSDASAEDRSGSVYFAASYRYTNGLKVSAIAGYSLYQSYSIYNSAGNEISKEKLKNAPYFGVAVGVDF